MIKSLSFLFAAFCAIGIPHLQPQKSNVQKLVYPEELVAPEASSIPYQSGDGGILKNNFASYYFNNLHTNYGYNAHGSCSYVAVEMLLNYYDTYWNDHFVEEWMEENADTTSVNGRIKDVTNSPGSHHESNPGISGVNEYKSYVGMNKNYYVHCALLSIGINQFNEIKYRDDGSWHVGTYLKRMVDITNVYLDQLTFMSHNDVTIRCYNKQDMSESQMRQRIVDMVKAGTPVIIDGAREDNSSAHSFIAFDYDETNDELYCNKGHQGVSTSHISFSDLPYPHINEIFYIEPNVNHFHSNNYYINEGTTTRRFCPCSQLIPQDLYAPETLYVDELPTFKWEVLIDDNYLRKFNASYTISILNRYHQDLYLIEDYTDDEITLTREQYDTILGDANCSTFYIHVQLINPHDYVDDYYVIKSYSKPYTFKYKTQIKPNEWGFEQRYYFLNEGIRTTTLTKGDLTVTTSRLRCGYIQNSYVVLSPRRANAGRAYFEMNFSQPIIAFSYSVCLWSANENLDGSAILQIKNSNGNWVTIQNLLDLNLTTKEQGIKRYKYMNYSLSMVNLIPTYEIDRIYGIRFETTATAVGSNNKGRLCIDDLVFNTSNPSGLLPSALQIADFLAWPLVYPKTRP